MRLCRAIGLLLLATALPALAGPTTVPWAYTVAARANNVPPVMLYALALTESGTNLEHGIRPWPWTLNIAGNGERYRTRAAACTALREALDQTLVVDVGLGQLNVRWQRDLFGAGERFDDPCDALSPYANLDAAAAILREGYAKRGSWIQAAGYYHRPAGGPPAARYRERFKNILGRLRNGRIVIAEAGTTGTGLMVAQAHTGFSAERTAFSAERFVQHTYAGRVVWINPDPRARSALD